MLKFMQQLSGGARTQTQVFPPQTLSPLRLRLSKQDEQEGGTWVVRVTNRADPIEYKMQRSQKDSLPHQGSEPTSPFFTTSLSSCLTCTLKTFSKIYDFIRHGTENGGSEGIRPGSTES